MARDGLIQAGVGDSSEQSPCVAQALTTKAAINACQQIEPELYKCPATDKPWPAPRKLRRNEVESVA